MASGDKVSLLVKDDVISAFFMTSKLLNTLDTQRRSIFQKWKWKSKRMDQRMLQTVQTVDCLCNVPNKLFGCWSRFKHESKIAFNGSETHLSDFSSNLFGLKTTSGLSEMGWRMFLDTQYLISVEQSFSRVIFTAMIWFNCETQQSIVYGFAPVPWL